MSAQFYAAGADPRVSLDPANPTSSPVRRSSASDERAASFGFDLAARRALVARETVAVARLFECAFERVYGYLARMVGDEHVAEDLTSETFLRIQRGLASYRPELALRPWLFTVASNVLRDHFSARREAAQDLAQLCDSAAEPQAKVDAPDASALRSERARAAFAALQALSDQARAVLVLRHYEELSYAEIAAALCISEDTARQRYVRALARLRVQLAEFAPQPGDQP